MNNDVKPVTKFMFQGVAYDTESEAILAKITWTMGLNLTAIGDDARMDIQESMTTNARELSGLFGKLSTPTSA